MPSRSRIKWREADKTKLSRTVGRFNQKRTRLIKLVPELEDVLPAKMDVKKLKSQISTRNDFNKTINRLERFLVKGAEDMVTTEGGVRTTKYQVKELKIQQRTINLYKKKQREEADVSTEKGTMGAINKMNLRPLTRNVEQASKQIWDNLVRSYEKQSMDSYYIERDEKYKVNYLKALSNMIGKHAAEDIEKIKKMKASDVVAMFYYDPNLQIDFLYDPEDEENIAKWFHESLNNYLEENNL